MKRFIYLIILLLPLVNGCTKTDSSPTLEKFDRYIFFSQGVETKASLIENKANLDGQTFGVVGFKYDNTQGWNEYKTTNPTPNVFYNETGTLVPTETLTCSSDGTATYEPLQGWSNTRKYTFFAYYPIENQNVTLVNLDGTPYARGTPAIKYTMNASSLASSMVDVMTAPDYTDKYWISSADNNIKNSDLSFQFVHRLSSLGLHVKNSSAAAITINSVIVLIDGIKHTNAIIPLDGTPVEYSGPALSSYAGFAINLTEAEKSVDATGSVINDKLIFIPQTDNISISLTIGYQRKYGDSDPTDEEFSTTAPISTTLKEAIKHILYVNFMDSNTYVMIKSGNWDDGPNVNHEFN